MSVPSPRISSLSPLLPIGSHLRKCLPSFAGVVVVFICNLMRIGRWSELSVDRVCHEHEVMREVDANETSGELGSAFGGTHVGIFQLSIP